MRQFKNFVTLNVFLSKVSTSYLLIVSKTLFNYGQLA